MWNDDDGGDGEDNKTKRRKEKGYSGSSRTVPEHTAPPERRVPQAKLIYMERANVVRVWLK